MAKKIKIDTTSADNQNFVFRKLCELGRISSLKYLTPEYLSLKATHLGSKFYMLSFVDELKLAGKIDYNKDCEFTTNRSGYPCYF